MRAIKGTVKNGVIQPQESVNLSEGQTVIIVTIEEDRANKPVSNSSKLSELLLLPELEDNEPIFERDYDTGRAIDL